MTCHVTRSDRQDLLTDLRQHCVNIDSKIETIRFSAGTVNYHTHSVPGFLIYNSPASMHVATNMPPPSLPPAFPFAVDDAVDAIWTGSSCLPCDPMELSAFLSLYLDKTPLGYCWTPETAPGDCMSSHGIGTMPAILSHESCTPMSMDWTVEATTLHASTPSETFEASSSDCEVSVGVEATRRDEGKTGSQQNQSQWTKEEHARFLQALEKYLPSGARKDPVTGKVSVGLGAGVAKQVSAFVGTRTPLQVRSHAQKHFLRLNKNGGCRR